MYLVKTTGDRSSWRAAQMNQTVLHQSRQHQRTHRWRFKASSGVVEQYRRHVRPGMKRHMIALLPNLRAGQCA